MPDGLEARVKVDDELKAALRERRNGLKLKELAEQLGNKGYKITVSTLSNIIGVGKNCTHLRMIPYDLYVEIRGEEPEKIYWKEPIDLAGKISPWYCFFFDVGKKELSRQVVEEARQQGLEYDLKSMTLTLFNDKRISKINPIITDILVNKFRNAAGMPQSSLDEIEEFVNSLGPVPPGRLKPYRVSWDEARPVSEDLQRLKGCGLTAIVGKGIKRNKLESGERALSLEKYLELQRELRELPPYRELLPYRLRLVQALRHAEDVLQSTESNLTWTELQLVNKGKQNYGEKAFMENIFPHYVSMKEEYIFPIECFEMIVRFPKNISDRYRRQLDIFAECVGNSFQYYKEGILDKNKKIGFDFGVTKDGTEARLGDAMRVFNYHNNTDLFLQPSMASSYSNTLRFP